MQRSIRLLLCAVISASSVDWALAAGPEATPPPVVQCFTTEAMAGRLAAFARPNTPNASFSAKVLRQATLTHPNTYQAAKIRFRLGRWALVKWFFSRNPSRLESTPPFEQALKAPLSRPELKRLYLDFAPWYFPEAWNLFIRPLEYAAEHQIYDPAEDRFTKPTAAQSAELQYGANQAANLSRIAGVFVTGTLLLFAGYVLFFEKSIAGALFFFTADLILGPLSTYLTMVFSHRSYHMDPSRETDRAYLTSNGNPDPAAEVTKSGLVHRLRQGGYQGLVEIVSLFYDMDHDEAAATDFDAWTDDRLQELLAYALRLRSEDPNRFTSKAPTFSEWLSSFGVSGGEAPGEPEPTASPLTAPSLRRATDSLAAERRKHLTEKVYASKGWPERLEAWQGRQSLNSRMSRREREFRYLFAPWTLNLSPGEGPQLWVQEFVAPWQERHHFRNRREALAFARLHPGDREVLDNAAIAIADAISFERLTHMRRTVDGETIPRTLSSLNRRADVAGARAHLRHNETHRQLNYLTEPGSFNDPEEPMAILAAMEKISELLRGTADLWSFLMRYPEFPATKRLLERRAAIEQAMQNLPNHPKGMREAVKEVVILVGDTASALEYEAVQCAIYAMASHIKNLRARGRKGLSPFFHTDPIGPAHNLKLKVEEFFADRHLHRKISEKAADRLETLAGIYAELIRAGSAEADEDAFLNFLLQVAGADSSNRSPKPLPSESSILVKEIETMTVEEALRILELSELPLKAADLTRHWNVYRERFKPAEAYEALRRAGKVGRELERAMDEWDRQVTQAQTAYEVLLKTFERNNPSGGDSTSGPVLTSPSLIEEFPVLVGKRQDKLKKILATSRWRAQRTAWQKTRSLVESMSRREREYRYLVAPHTLTRSTRGGPKPLTTREGIQLWLQEYVAPWRERDFFQTDEWAEWFARTHPGDVTVLIPAALRITRAMMSARTVNLYRQVNGEFVLRSESSLNRRAAIASAEEHLQHNETHRWKDFLTSDYSPSEVAAYQTFVRALLLRILNRELPIEIQTMFLEPNPPIEMSKGRATLRKILNDLGFESVDAARFAEHLWHLGSTVREPLWSLAETEARADFFARLVDGWADHFGIPSREGSAQQMRLFSRLAQLQERPLTDPERRQWNHLMAQCKGQASRGQFREFLRMEETLRRTVEYRRAIDRVKALLLGRIQEFQDLDFDVAVDLKALAEWKDEAILAHHRALYQQKMRPVKELMTDFQRLERWPPDKDTLENLVKLDARFEASMADASLYAKELHDQTVKRGTAAFVKELLNQYEHAVENYLQPYFQGLIPVEDLGLHITYHFATFDLNGRLGAGVAEMIYQQHAEFTDFYGERPHLKVDEATLMRYLAFKNRVFDPNVVSAEETLEALPVDELTVAERSTARDLQQQLFEAVVFHAITPENNRSLFDNVAALKEMVEQRLSRLRQLERDDRAQITSAQADPLRVLGLASMPTNPLHLEEVMRGIRERLGPAAQMRLSQPLKGPERMAVVDAMTEDWMRAEAAYEAVQKRMLEELAKDSNAGRRGEVNVTILLGITIAAVAVLLVKGGALTMSELFVPFATLLLGGVVMTSASSQEDRGSDRWSTADNLRAVGDPSTDPARREALARHFRGILRFSLVKFGLATWQNAEDAAAEALLTFLAAPEKYGGGNPIAYLVGIANVQGRGRRTKQFRHSRLEQLRQASQRKNVSSGEQEFIIADVLDRIYSQLDHKTRQVLAHWQAGMGLSEDEAFFRERYGPRTNLRNLRNHALNRAIRIGRKLVQAENSPGKAVAGILLAFGFSLGALTKTTALPSLSLLHAA